MQAFPHRLLAASADTATIESAANVTAAITTNVTTGSTDNVTVVDPTAVAMTTNASVAELVAPNITVDGLVTATLLNDADYVAAPVPVVGTTILNISATNASASVLVSLTAIWNLHPTALWNTATTWTAAPASRTKCHSIWFPCAHAGDLLYMFASL